MAATVAALAASLAMGGSAFVGAATAAAHHRAPAAKVVPLPADPYSGVPGSTGTHRTEVEPSLASNGSTLVAAFQAGRHGAGGADNIDTARSTDHGRTWQGSSPPGITKVAGGPFDGASDPSVAYDALHHTWLTGAVDGNTVRPLAVTVSRSTDDGRTFAAPVTAATGPGIVDKDWITCDDGVGTSRFAGTCYLTWEDGLSHQIYMQRSTDGGATWSAPVPPVGALGIGGEPLVRPEGRAFVPYVASGALDVFGSTDGGATWTQSTQLAPLHERNFGTTLRTSATPSTAISADGHMFAAWQGCEPGPTCQTDKVLLSKSDSGFRWSKPVVVPTRPGTVDSIAPAIAVQGQGLKTKMAITYYRDSHPGCAEPCKLSVETVTSPDGGRTWSKRHVLATGIDTRWLVNAEGPMFGDYIGEAFAPGGKAVSVFVKASAPSGGLFHERVFSNTLQVG